MILQAIRRRPSPLALHIVKAMHCPFDFIHDPHHQCSLVTLNLISRDQVACAVDSRSLRFHAMPRVNKNFPLRPRSLHSKLFGTPAGAFLAIAALQNAYRPLQVLCTRASP
jgi:hypothetical protein